MGKIGQMLSSFSENGVLKKASPVKLEIHANVRRAYPGEAVATDMHELKYLKEDRARLLKEVKDIKKQLENWIPEDIAALAKKSLEKQLADRESDLEVCKMRVQHAESESEESDEEPEEGE